MFEGVDEGHVEINEKETKELHYFYNREERLAKAPQNVRDYYEGRYKPVRGIKIFFTKQNRYIFIALLIFVAAAFIYNGLNGTRKYSKINELDCEISAFSYEDQIYTSLSLKRNVKSKKIEPQKVDAQFFLVDADNQVVAKENHSIIYSEGEQFIRFKNSDFEIVRVDVIINVDNQENEISCKVKR